MTLDQLYAFSEVCYCKSIKKASANLYISYQAVSRSIHKLEEELDTILFTRTPEGVSLTPAGQVLLSHVKNITQELSQLENDMKNFHKSSKKNKTIKISLSPALMTSSAKSLANYLSNVFPDILFHYSTITYFDNPNYEDSDISVRLYCETSDNTKQHVLPPPYKLKQLSYFPLYFWISGFSPLIEYSYLDFNVLKNSPCILLKQKFNISQYYSLYYKFSKTILKHQPLIAELEHNLIEYIEHHNFYTIDIRSPLDNTLFFQKLFSNHNIILKESPYNFYLTLIYNEESCKYISSIIESFFAPPSFQ